MKTHTLGFFAFVAFCLISFGASAQETLQNYFGNMLGRWHMQTERGVLVEDWEAINENHFKCTSYKMYLGDTTELEEVSLTLSGQTAIYEVLVYRQNGGKSVTYTGKLTRPYDQPLSSKRAYANMHVKFVKLDHDYPKFIDYYFDDNQLRVIIANREDLQGGQDFTFKRIH